MADWTQMMSAMDEVEGNKSQGRTAMGDFGADNGLNEIGADDLRVRSAVQMEAAHAQTEKKDILDMDMQQYNSAPPPVNKTRPQSMKHHKGSYECADMYSQMLQEQDTAKAMASGYSPPPSMQQPPPQPMQQQQPMQQPPQQQPVQNMQPQTQYSRGGSLLEQVRKANTPVAAPVQNQGGQPTQLNEGTAYQQFMRQDYLRKRGAIHAISEKLSSIDINNCDPDSILNGITGIMNKLNNG